jgi:hypothetical protein
MHINNRLNTALWYYGQGQSVKLKGILQSENIVLNIVTYSGCTIHDGTLLHPKSQYTTVKHSQKLFEHTYTSDPHGLGTLTLIEFSKQDLLWQSSNTHSHSCSQKASKHTSGQSIVGLSVHLHSTTAPRRIATSLTRHLPAPTIGCLHRPQ